MRVTVGIPTHNEEKIIGHCIESIYNQRGVKPFEVIIVASGCTDNTVKIVQKYKSLHSNLKLIIERERKGKISALNKVLSNAKGDIIFHTDGDVILEKSCLIRTVNNFKNKNIIAVSGRPEVIETNPPIFYNWAKNSENILMKKKLREQSSGSYFHLCGYALAHRNGALSELPLVKGATDATMGQLLSEKGKIIFDPRLIARVIYPREIGDFINQKARIRYGFLKLNLKRPSQRTPLNEVKEILNILKVCNLQDLIFLPFMLLIYLAAWIKAYLLYFKDADLSEIWVPVSSTKKL